MTPLNVLYSEKNGRGTDDKYFRIEYKMILVRRLCCAVANC